MHVQTFIIRCVCRLLNRSMEKEAKRDESQEKEEKEKEERQENLREKGRKCEGRNKKIKIEKIGKREEWPQH